jgi:hypothetical protein
MREECNIESVKDGFLGECQRTPALHLCQKIDDGFEGSELGHRGVSSIDTHCHEPGRAA